MDFDPNNAINAITTEGKQVMVTKFGYKQENAFIDDSGATYIQNVSTLELEKADIDEDFVDQREAPAPAMVIQSTPPPEQAEARKAAPRKAEAAK